MFPSSLPAPATTAPRLALFVADTRRRADNALISLADRAHANGDALARSEGWTVTRTGRTGRQYRSPLFDRWTGLDR